MSYRKSYMGPNDRFMGDVGGDAIRRQQEDRSRQSREDDTRRYLESTYGDDVGSAGGGSFGEVLLKGAMGMLGVIAFLPGASLGVVVFIKLIGSVTESWHVLGLVAAFFVGGVGASMLVVFVSAAALLAALVHVLSRAWNDVLLRAVILATLAAWVAWQAIKYLALLALRVGKRPDTKKRAYAVGSQDAWAFDSAPYAQ